MNEELKKALESLIEETIGEIEELKKSRFSAAEVEIKGPGEGIAGKPTNGKIEKDDKDEDEDDKDKVDKAECGINKEADPGPVHHSAADGIGKSEVGKNKEADPGPVHHSAADGIAKKDDDDDKDKKDKKDKDKGKEKSAPDMDEMGYMKGCIKKSQDEVSTLMKSYIDERVMPLESKLSSILDLVNKIADQPAAPAKGVTARMQPLQKSGDEMGTLMKSSEVSTKLFELKKSGTQVDSLDVTKAELGQDLQAIVKKYSIA